MKHKKLAFMIGLCLIIYAIYNVLIIIHHFIIIQDKNYNVVVLHHVMDIGSISVVTNISIIN